MSDPSGPDFDRGLFVQARREAPSEALRQRIRMLGRTEIERGRRRGLRTFRRGRLRAALIACAAGLGGLLWLCGKAEDRVSISAENAAPRRTEARAPAPDEPTRSAEPSERSPDSPAARSIVTRAPTEPRVVPGRETTRLKSADAGAVPAAPTPAAEAQPVPSLTEQVGQLKRARAALKAGQPQGALDLLDEYPSAGGGSQLAAEARLLRIEALAALGRKDEAASEARRFVTDYPTSPLTDRAQGFLR